MKKIILTIAIISIPLFLNAQVDNKIKNGINKEYYDSGVLKLETPYVNGIKNGIQKTYFESGRLEEELPYVNGKINGFKKRHYESGEIMSISPFSNDKENGLSKGYRKNGTLMSEWPYVNGKINGVQKYFYETGELSAETPYLNDKREGVSKEYWKSGKVKIENTYINGHGVLEKTYYKNGNLKAYFPGGVYDNKTILIAKYYHENGKLSQFFPFKERKRGQIITHGIRKYFDNSGQLISEEDYRDGKKNGFSKKYYNSGKLKSVTSFLNDKRNGICKYYFENGELGQESNYLNDKLQGRFKAFFESGKLELERNYVNGKIDGYYKIYYEEGQLKEVSTYKNGNYYTDGTIDNGFKLYREDGTIEQIVYYFHEVDGDGFTSSFNKKIKYDTEGKTTRILEITNPQFLGKDFNLDEFNFKNDFSIELSFDINRVQNKKIKFDILVGINSDSFQRLSYTIYDNRDSNLYYDNFMKETQVDGIILKHKIIPFSVKGIYKKFGDKVKVMISKIGKQYVYTVDGHVLYVEEDIQILSNLLRLNLIEGRLHNLRLKIKQKLNQNHKIVKRSISLWSKSGTGFFVDNRGYIATNFHVVSNAKIIEIEQYINGVTKNYKAEIVQIDEHNDLAIIKIIDNQFVILNEIPYNFKTETIDVGSSVFALGYPLALTSMGREIKFTDGKISSKTGFKGSITTYQMTTPLQHGNSGGPLFDYNGNLVGINSANISPDKADNVSYAIKSSYLEKLIKVIPNKIALPKNKSLLNESLTSQIKILSDVVVLIKVKTLSK